MNNRQKALKRVQMYSFCITEANLFLDTHPHCKQALEYVKQMKQAYEIAYNDFVNRYGALRATDIEDGACEWEWIKGPWPWMNEEGKQNVEL